MQKKQGLFLLSIVSGILLSVAWFWHLTFLIFFAFVPLLIIENRLSTTPDVKRKNLKIFGYTYLSFLIWNLLVTWWVYYASATGILAFTFNSLFMAMAFVLFSRIKNRLKKEWALWLLIPVWIAWEQLHSYWDLSWPWLTLGNVFAFNHNWVQWYEFTGTSGGTLWVLASNLLIFATLKNNASLKFISVPVLKIAGIIIVPIFISYFIFFIRHSSANKQLKVNTLVVQPNLDPYNVKFELDYQSQFIQMLNLIRPKINSDTRYLVLPETFITDNINEKLIDNSLPVQWFRDSLLKNFPELTIIVGASTYLIYDDEKDKTASSRKDPGVNKFVDFFNTALQIDNKGVSIYHKSKLVPGAEILPFAFLFKPFEWLALDLGGTTGTLGSQKERSTFKNSMQEISVAPVICYESVYADYVSGYLRNGANFIFIITNDGWWDNTPGHVQHLNYARLRAIESRRQIARSANTGISCFIDEFGTISDETEYWKEAVIQKNISPKYELTFFSRFGDLISYFASILTLGLMAWASILRFRK